METRPETANRPIANTQFATADTNRPLGDGGNGVIRQAKDTINQGVDKFSRGTGQIYDSAIQYSKKNPRAAIGIALASGATLGFLLGRSNKVRNEDSLLGAVTAAALRAAIHRWR